MIMPPYELQSKAFTFLVIFVSIISLMIIYSKANSNIGNRREMDAFKGMLISFMVFSFIDLRQIWGNKFYTDVPYFIRCVVIAVGFLAMSFSCFFWFLHVFSSLHLKHNLTRIGSIHLWKLVIHIPLFICLILVLPPLRTFIYDPVDELSVFKPGAALLLLLDYVYLIIATIISIYCIKRAKNKIEKKKYKSQAIFIICFTLSGMMIGFMTNLPAIELCFIPIVLKLFVELQDSQIYTDVLTKLYNRRRMTEFISEEIGSSSNESPFIIILIDLDFFKSINDILGHDEGDRALVSFSNAIQNSISSKNGIAARWGGDEFIVAGKDKSLATEFVNDLKREVQNINDLDYMPSFSTGIYSCTSPTVTFEEALVQADTILYKDKEIQHKNIDSFISTLHSIKNKE